MHGPASMRVEASRNLFFLEKEYTFYPVERRGNKEREKHRPKVNYASNSIAKSLQDRVSASEIFSSPNQTSKRMVTDLLYTEGLRCFSECFQALPAVVC